MNKKAPTREQGLNLNLGRTDDSRNHNNIKGINHLTISQRRHVYRVNHFLRPGCIASLPEDIERPRVPR